jgi:xylan 1,4-beta-xylosidase
VSFEAEAATYNLTVQANHQTQAWNRFYEKAVATDHQYTLITSYWNRGIGKALKFGHDSAGFQYWRGHAVLDADVGLVVSASATSLTLNWTNWDKVYDTGLAVGMHPICEISCTPPPLANGSCSVSANYNGVTPSCAPPNKYGWGQWVALMDSIVTHIEKRYGVNEVRNNWYFEVWNEPNWWYTGFPQYISLFDYTVYGLKLADSLVRVGGPACQGNYIFQNDDEVAKLLNHCQTGYDSATGKTGTKIDFLTYHCYADNPMTIYGITGSVLNPNTNAAVQKMVVDSLKSASYSWFTGPVFEDEAGPTVDVPAQRDMQQSASWLARTIHLLNEGGPKYPPPSSLGYWAISDIYEEGMDATGTISFEQGNYGLMCRGTPNYANSYDIPKPVFQAYRLLHKLGAYEDSSWGGLSNTSTGNGVSIIATSSDTGSGNDSIQILVYDHYVSTSQSSAPTDSVILTVNNIPWAPGPVHVEDFLIDTTHSNTFTKWVGLGKPAVPTNAQWDSLRKVSYLAHYDSVTTTTLTGTTFTKAYLQHYFSVMLMVLSNPNATAVKRQSYWEKNAVSSTLRAEIRKGKMMLVLPENDRYTVTLLSESGRTVATAKTSGSGMVDISMPKIPAGAYIVQCSGTRRSYSARVVAAP